MRLISDQRLPDGTRQLTVRVKEDCKKFSSTPEEAERCEMYMKAGVSASPDYGTNDLSLTHSVL